MLTFKYALMAVWLLLGLGIGTGALFGRPVRGGMVTTRPPLRNSWPLLLVIWMAAGFIGSAFLMPW